MKPNTPVTQIFREAINETEPHDHKATRTVQKPFNFQTDKRMRLAAGQADCENNENDSVN